MKKILFFTTFLASLSLGAKVGCMDKSKHGNICDGYDYKTLHYVHCTCPCDKYRHMSRKNKCFKCRHYMKPNEQLIGTEFLHDDMKPDIYW